MVILLVELAMLFLVAGLPFVEFLWSPRCLRGFPTWAESGVYQERHGLNHQRHGHQLAHHDD